MMQFVDSNLWIHGLIKGDDSVRHRLVAEWMRGITAPVVSTQVVNEVCANAVRKARNDQLKAADLITAFYQGCFVALVTEASIKANDLRHRYSLSFWDSQLIACSLLAGCATLESEDVCDGLVIESSLTIRNPLK